MKRFIILTIILLLLSGILIGQIPKTITFQGILTDSDGKVKPDGKYYLNAKLFDNSTGGTEVWSENNISVNSSGGIINAILGTMTALPEFNRELWLEIQILGEQPMQRIKIHSVPYSLYSEKSRISIQSLASGFADTSAYSLRTKFADSSIISRTSKKSDSSTYSVFSRKADSSSFAQKSVYSDTSDYSRKSKFADSSAKSFKSSQSDSAGKSYNSIYADTARFSYYGVLPVGSVVAFAGKKEKIPANWMLCNGAALSSASYRELYAVIDSCWGNGSDDSLTATDFNLPDLQGMFLRGVDEAQAMIRMLRHANQSRKGAIRVILSALISLMRLLPNRLIHRICQQQVLSKLKPRWSPKVNIQISCIQTREEMRTVRLMLMFIT